MITFQFTVNDSFNTYSTHPITVPKSQVDYSELKKQTLDSGDFIITFPRGERVRGHMYSGDAGYGHYYQIRTYPDEVIPQYLAEGDDVIIIIFSHSGNKYVVLEYRE